MKRFQSSLILASYLVLAGLVGCAKKEAERPLAEKLSALAESTSEPTDDRAARTNKDSVQTEQTTDISIVQADVRKDLRAMFSGDVDTALAYLYPKLIELLGGSAKVRHSLQKQLAEFQESQITMESLTFPEPPTFLKSGTHQFAIIPTKKIHPHEEGNGYREHELSDSR